jgi:hypothetical protein
MSTLQDIHVLMFGICKHLRLLANVKLKLQMELRLLSVNHEIRRLCWIIWATPYNHSDLYKSKRETEKKNQLEESMTDEKSHREM